MVWLLPTSSNIFFFNDTATTEIYTLSLHDALPIWTGLNLRQTACDSRGIIPGILSPETFWGQILRAARPDRKSTRLNSSHSQISYAVFCLQKKKDNSEQNS